MPYVFFKFAGAEAMRKKIVNRIKHACHTNEPQSMMALLLTGINIVACLTVEGAVPWQVWIIAIMFWPTLAFIFNLIDPIPIPKDSQEKKQ